MNQNGGISILEVFHCALVSFPLSIQIAIFLGFWTVRMRCQGINDIYNKKTHEISSNPTTQHSHSVTFNWCSMPVMSEEERMEFEYISTKRDKSVNGANCVRGGTGSKREEIKWIKSG